MITRRHFIAGLGAAAALAVAAPFVAGAMSPAAARGLVVHKDPLCGCCGAWADYLRAAGFTVDERASDDLAAVKAALGVPDDLASCHTGEIEGYVVEGHVPLEAIERLLAERPESRGIAVPGMPIGSPGMEVPGTAPERYEVVLFGANGRARFGDYVGGERVGR